jgi:glycosyltransferase involved in cell wall biosynthesis
MKYDVTIGIPMYNVENFIERTMNSALSQTYQSIEYLVLDDGSDDRTLEVILKLQANHPRGNDIYIITHAENMGVSIARNRILEESQGEFLFFLDSDDIIREDAISLMMTQVKEHGADIVFGSMEKFFLTGERTIYQYPKMYFHHEDEFAIFSYRRYAGIQASACNFLVRMSIIRENGLSFYKSNYWEDFVFVLDLVTYINRAVLLSDITYTYICRQNSLSNFQKREHIDKEEILRNIGVAEYMKSGSLRLKEKPYFPHRCYVAVMTDFYIACHILKRRKDIVPPISDHEIKGLFTHPASFSQISSFRQARLKNLVLYFIGKLPAPLCVTIIWLMGKIKKLI